ncbi:hypothetical protein OD507_004225 [Salmonella enterica]|nr:hypothetical protein [Salmonella enterica]EJX4247709.1 hypothetical protein [Salmonella enterica]EJX4535545.1 hypothetical protein [Salmonella enterica]
MPKNEFKAFAVGENANVLTQTEYENLPAVTSGFQAGIAESVQLNKVWRQASVIAAMLGQFTADKSGDDVVDDGKLDVLMNSFVKALFNNSTEQLDPRYLKKDQNGEDIPDKPGFIENLGLKETLNPTKRVSIGNIGTGAFDGSTPSINIGDSDSGFIGSADGVIDIYCNNAKVGYIDLDGLHMNTDVSTNRNVILRGDDRKHIMMQDADGTPRMYIFKDKGGDGVHLNNGNDASTEYLFHKDGSFYAPFAVRAGGSKKLAVQANDNSTLSAMFNLWGDANRPTVIELDDDQGWHLYSQRNPDGSILFTVNGDIMANRNLNAGSATVATDGNVNGTVWGGWLNDFLNNNYNRKNTASLGDYGWVRDESTGFIMQWGTLNSSNGTYNFPRTFPVACLAVFVTNTSSQGALVDNAFGYPVNNSQFFAATKASNSAGIGAYPVAFFAIGR